jgi:hypothetical protein
MIASFFIFLWYTALTMGLIVVLCAGEKERDAGSEWVITGKNNVTGSLVMYAGHGETIVENNINFKEVTGYKIRSKNNAVVIYESGLASPLFTGGPSGGLNIKEWREVK